METNQAIELLIQVAHLAQSKGVLNLDDAVLVVRAIETLKASNNQKEERPMDKMEEVLIEQPKEKKSQPKSTTI
jgi:hypothetical protein